MRLISFLLILMLILSAPATAAKKAYAEEGQVLTKGQAVMLLSATDFMKKKIGSLLSWTVGYDISQISQVKLTPTINYIKATPKRVPPDGRTVVEIMASVSDPGGMVNISGVRADLSTIGRLSNTMLVDNGLFGDLVAGDGIYTLQTSVPMRIDTGAKEVAVAVANKKGWLALAKTSLDVKKNPVILEAGFAPDWIKADGRSIALLTVKIDNPGRLEDVKGVTADLRAFGFQSLKTLYNDSEQGDVVANDNVYSLQFIVPHSVNAGEYNVRVGVSNFAGGYATQDVKIRVVK
ncbi:MAG: hypothetical protein ABIE84_00160 [bacterium]